jgi:hypothetical protein
MQISAASGKKRVKTNAGRGCASDEAKLTRIAAPTNARSAANVSATRKKFSQMRERNGRGFVALYAAVEASTVSRRK